MVEVSSSCKSDCNDKTNVAEMTINKSAGTDNVGDQDTTIKSTKNTKNTVTEGFSNHAVTIDGAGNETSFNGVWLLIMSSSSCTNSSRHAQHHT